MPQTSKIEDYALIGDMQTAGLVSRAGSIDWLCFPRFDSGACFAALLGDPRHGRWQIAPADQIRDVTRRYRPDTLVLETEFSTASGRVRLIDCMPPRGREPDVLRIVEGVEGRVAMRMELILRFDYGSIVPWVHRSAEGLHAVGGPDAVILRTPVDTHGEQLTTVAEFAVAAGERVPFVLGWHPSHEPVPPAIDPFEALEETTAIWREWSDRCTYEGPWRDQVRESLVVLKALTFQPSGGIVAAPTTSLPERIGGVRNWDYRYCWLRDATFTLYALLISGHREEANAWRNWLMRSIAGEPSRIQIMYGVTGERRMLEHRIDWLPGYEGSVPVRVGNAAMHQLQLDVYGEVMDVLHQGRRAGLDPDAEAWQMQRHLLAYLAGAWQQPDEGLWEVRGPRRHFTHSKMMCWVAFDRAIKAVERYRVEGPLQEWRAIRDHIHADVCRHGFDPAVGAFTQSYGSTALDASLLLMPLVGFLPAGDPRMQGTVRAIERQLCEDGLVLRYRSDEADDGLPPGEGAFLACSFWLADNYARAGRRDDAHALFERLLALRNDVGLLAEEYDPVAGRQLGNFPQAFSHVGLINTAFNLTPREHGPAAERPAT